MINKKRTTKAERITNDIRAMIRRDAFLNGRLPSKKDLMVHYQVSHQTIDTVLRNLREEGLIRGVRGTGIFINTTPVAAVNLTSSMVLMFMPDCTPYENEPYRALRSTALKYEMLPIHINMPTPTLPLSLQERAILTQLLRAPIKGVLYNGRSYHRHRFLDDWKNIRSVALMLFDSDTECPGSSLLMDGKTNGALVAQHLIDCGCRKLLFISSYIAPDVPVTAQYLENHIDTQTFSGVCAKAKACGIAMPEKISMPAPGSPSSKDFFSKILTQGYDGIACCTDSIAYGLCKAARNDDIPIPEKIKIAACYETGMAMDFEFAITALSYDWLDVAEKALHILEAGGVQHLKLTPVIHIRQSTCKNQGVKCL